MKLIMRFVVFPIVAIAFLLAQAKPASAHSVAFAWKFGDTCDTITLYLGTYHQTYELTIPRGGVKLNGVRYNFTGLVEDLPANIDGSTYSAGFTDSSGPYGPVRWQTVTFSGLVEGTYSVAPTNDSQVEEGTGYGWPRSVTIICPPEKKTKVATVAVTAWGTNDTSGVSWQFQDSSGNWQWVLKKDGSTKIITKIEYRDTKDNNGNVIKDYPISSLIILHPGVAPIDPSKWRVFDAYTLKQLPNIWIRIGDNFVFVP
jgi:hypothetical protein